MCGRSKAIKKNFFLRGSKVVKKCQKSKKLCNLIPNLEFWAYFAYFGPTQKEIFLNALGLLHILVKCFWKSGKNWNFGDFFNILIFSSFFLIIILLFEKKLEKVKILNNSPKFQFLPDLKKFLTYICGRPRALKRKFSFERV